MIRLECVERGHGPEGAAVLQAIRDARGEEPAGVLKTLYYRPELFGEPFSAELDTLLRGPSEWTEGERELFAAFASLVNQCPF